MAFIEKTGVLATKIWLYLFLPIILDHWQLWLASWFYSMDLASYHWVSSYFIRIFILLHKLANDNLVHFQWLNLASNVFDWFYDHNLHASSFLLNGPFNNDFHCKWNFSHLLSSSPKLSCCAKLNSFIELLQPFTGRNVNVTPDRLIPAVNSTVGWYKLLSARHAPLIVTGCCSTFIPTKLPCPLLRTPSGWDCVSEAISLNIGVDLSTLDYRFRS